MKLQTIGAFFLAIILLTGIAYAAPSFTYQPSLIPITTSTYTLGTTTRTWLNIYVDQVCLTSDTCRTTWPSGGSGGSGNVGTSSTPVIGQIPYWTTTTATPALLGTIATTSLGVTAPITFSGTLFAQIGGTGGTFGCTTAGAGTTGCLSGTDWSRFNSPTTTFSSPLVYTLGTNAVTCPTCSTITTPVSILNGGTATTTQVTNGVNFYDGTRITSGTALSWDGTTLKANTANAALAVTNGAQNISINSSYSGSLPMIGTVSTDPLALMTNNTERARFTSAGMFGFGTTTAQWPLTASHATLPQLSLTDTTSANNAWTLRSISNSFYLATSTYSATSTTAALAFDPNGASTFGNGTINLGSGSNLMLLEASSTQSNAILIQNQTTSTGNSLTGLSVTTSGNVGIGTSTPANPLFIQQPNGAAIGNRQLVFTDGLNRSFELGMDTSFNFNLDSEFGGSWANDLNVNRQTGLFTIVNGAILQASSTVLGNFTTTGNNVTSGSGTFASLSITNGSQSMSINPSYSGSLPMFGNISNDPLAFMTNNTERIRILKTGFIGIATTTPTHQLVVGDPTASQLANSNFTILGSNRIGAVTSNRVVGMIAPQSATGYASVFGYDYAGSASMNLQLQEFGNFVGIATSTPQWELTASNATSPQLALTDASAGSNAWTMRSIGNSFYLATSTYTATSTTAAFSITPNGVPSFGDAPLGLASGGLGAITFPVGALLVGNTTTGINSVSDVATNQVLVSGGTNTNPAYSASPTITTLNTGTINITDNAAEIINGNWGMNIKGSSDHPVQIIGPLLAGFAAGFPAGVIFPTDSMFVNSTLQLGTTTSKSVFQATASSSNATTSIQFGKSGQNKGTCMTLYRTDGTPIYAYVAAGATTITLTTTITNTGCQN